MIEGESNERFLKNWNERFWQIVCQRTQPRAQPRTEDKSLRNHVLPRSGGFKPPNQNDSGFETATLFLRQTKGWNDGWCLTGSRRIIERGGF